MPTQRLIPDQITAAALKLADTLGPDGLTMRALADRLGVGTMTLYGYFRSREELLDAVVDAATAPTLIGPAATEPGAGLRALFTGLYGVLTRHPGLHQVRGSRPFLSPGVLRLTDRAVGLLTDAGLDDAAAVRAYRTLYLFTLGCATYGRQDPTAIGDALRRLPDDDFHHIRRVGPAMIATAGSADEFTDGLDILVAALTA